MEIKLGKVDFTYHKNAYEEVLKKINLEIKEGRITGIIGKNGSGKSTLLKLLAGLLKPTSGYIKIGNTILNEHSKLNHEFYKMVGFLPQFPEEYFCHDTVEKEIGSSVMKFHYRVEEKEKRMKESLYMVGLDETYLNRDPLTLSTGEKKKVALASILIYNPKILLLDDPIVGLDESGKKTILKILRLLKRKYQKTIILVTQDIDFLHKFVDDVVVLYDGKVVSKGNKYDVFKEEVKLEKFGMEVPKMIHFSNLVYAKKKKKIGYRDEINDLIKDIYRYVN